MAAYTPTIGLEIHAELKTKSKLFCDSKNDPDETRPNTNICPVCMGYPGTLPVVNKEAVRHLIRIGLAIGGSIAPITYFDRKNYFYPDIPKGFQISQYKHPIVSGGELAGVSITRVHLEEDTARSQHVALASLIDFNRAGLPLMELVTEPVITSALQAGRFARELQLLLRYLEAGDANMEKGEMRVEANVSVSKGKEFGTKVEVKNLNSFRAVERAILYETKRQIALIERGDTVLQETRGWDEAKQETFPQRLKEESQDYRYFPEPDLTTFRPNELFDIEELRSDLPELPEEKRKTYQKQFGLSEEVADVLVRDVQKWQLFSEAVTPGERDKLSVKEAQAVANYIVSEIPALLGTDVFDTTKVTPQALARLARMKNEGTVSSRGVKEVLVVLLREGGEVEVIAKEKGLLQKSNEDEIANIVSQILTEYATAAEEYRAGKETSLQFLIGQGMKMTQGSANPEILKKLLVQKLK